MKEKIKKVSHLKDDGNDQGGDANDQDKEDEEPKPLLGTCSQMLRIKNKAT
jgi:hypothetical protein